MSFIFDSNIIIYSSLPEYSALQKFTIEHDEYCSRISYLEVLGYHKLTPPDKKYFEALFDRIRILEIDEGIILEATSLRQKTNIASCDAIIAATALLYGLELVTNNEKDFNNIKGLKIINPLRQ